MDDALATLATSGAQAIVTLMVTDAWQKTKGLAIRIFSHKSPREAETIAQELEASRNKILTLDSASSDEIMRHEIDRWEAHLRLTLLEDDVTAALIEELIEVAKGQHSIGSATAGDISMRAKAKGTARIYQQGQGIQYNG
jgi:hypothetical protein